MAEREPARLHIALVLVLVLTRQVNGLRVLQLGSQDDQAQVFADAVAAFGSSGEDTVIELPRGRIFSLRNATIVNAQASPGYTPFSSGTLTIQPAAGDSSEPTVLDAAMLYGIASVDGSPTTFKGAILRLNNLVLVNQCEVPYYTDFKNQVYAMTSSTLPLFPRTAVYRSQQCVNITVYVRQADMAAQVYVATAMRPTFPKFDELTSSVTAEWPPTPIKALSTSEHAVVVSWYKSSAVAAVQITFKSIANPFDALLTTLEANGVMMEPRICKGLEKPGGDPLADYWDPAMPLWLAADTPDWVLAVSQATSRLTVPPTKYRPPFVVMLVSGTAMPASIRPIPAMTPLQGPLLLSGPFCDVPGLACAVALDFSGIQGPFLPVTASGLLFVHLMTLKGLSTQPLPSTATNGSSSAGGSASVFPLSAFPLASGAEAIAMSTVTLVLPDLDYLAMLTLAQPSLSTCVNATVKDHATNLQAGITSLSVFNMEPGYPSMVLTTFVGWGLNASLLQLQPANPSLPYALLQACPQLLTSTATDQGSCSLSTQQVAIIAGCSVAGLVVLLAALLLGLLLVMRHHRPQSQPSVEAQGTNVMATGKEANGMKTADIVLSDKAASGQASSQTAPGTGRPAQVAASVRTPFMGLNSSNALSSTEGSLAPGAPRCDSDSCPGGIGIANGGALRDVGSDAQAPLRDPEPRHVQELADYCNRHATLHAKEPNSGKQLVLFLSRLPPVLPPALGAVEIVLQPYEEEPVVRSSDGTAHPISIQQDPGIVEPAVPSAKPSHPKTMVQRLVTEMTSDNAEMVEIHGVLGKGSWGTVFLGAWRGLQVAIKTLVFESQGEQVPGTAAPDNQRHNQAIMEAAVAASVDHKNVVRTYHYDIKEIITQERTDTESVGGLQIDMSASHGGCKEYKLYLIQELCATSLSRAISEGTLHHPSTGKLRQLVYVLDLLLDIAQGLEYLHSRNIVHGDLKPANVLLQPCTGPPGVVAKLADFGLSARLGAEATHLSNYRSGTPFYVAPEVVHEHRTSTASDIFSFGVLIWQLYTGMPPYQLDENTNYSWSPCFPNFREPNVPPPALAMVIHQCLSREPRHRPTATTIIKRLKMLKKSA